jgi:dienelactone hydrolase
MTAMTFRRTTLLGLLALTVGSAAAVVVYGDGASLVIQAAGIQGWPRTVATWASATVREEARTIPTRYGTVRARIFTPEGRVRRSILMVPGVHASGVDEPRLVGFARDIAAQGDRVITTELPDLTQYRITPQSTDVIEDAARWTIGDPMLSPDGRLGMIGISFGGGLSIVAAGRTSLRDRVVFAVSFGGHGDLPRTLHYLCTGVLPDGSQHPPHDYGVAIILLGVADRMVPTPQVEPLRRAILTFLEGARLDMVDKVKSRETFARAVSLATALPEPAKTLMGYVNTRDVSRLGPLLLPHLGLLAGDPSLSPERSAPPTAPVYLLHGSDDSVIPAMESELLARHLRRTTRVVFLASPLITHAEVDQPSDLREVWKLISFWSDVLHE